MIIPQHSNQFGGNKQILLMRTQDQSSQPSDLIQGMILKDQSIRNDLDYVEPINQNMKQATEKYKMKLNSSHSTEVIGFRSQPLPGNLVTWQRRIHGQLSQTHSPQPNSQSLFFRRDAPEVPEENDDGNASLHKELMASRRENERLNQIIAQNHAKAIDTIGQLQIALRAANIENERIKTAFEASAKQANDGRDRLQGKQPPCPQCPSLIARIQELEHIRSELSRRLDEQIGHSNEFNRSMDIFRETMNKRFSEMEAKLHSKSQEVIRLEQNNMELSRRLQEREHQLTQHTSIIQEYHSISEVYQRTVAECTRLTTEVETLEKNYKKSEGQLKFLSSKIEILYSQFFRGEERERTDHGFMMEELEHRVSQLRYFVEYRMTENQNLEERLAEKDISIQKLREEYALAVERVNQKELIQIQSKQRFEDLQFELNRLKSSGFPPSLNQNQLLLNQKQLEEIIDVERQAISDLQETIQQKERIISDLEIHIKTIKEQYNTLSLHYQEEHRRYDQIINKITAEKQSIRQSKTGLIEQNKQQESRNEAFAERQELIRRLQQSEAALEELNRQPLTQYKRIGELEQLVIVLRQEITRYETIVAHSHSQQSQLHRQNQLLIQQIDMYQKRFREREEENKPQQEQKAMVLMKQEIRKTQEDNRRLINDIEKLQSSHLNRLKEAEDYISRLLEQIQTQKKVSLHQETIVIENKTLIHQKQVLLSENQSLRIQLEQTIKHLEQQFTQNPSQRDPNATIEISNLRVKNDELSIHLQSAERYISSLEEQINRLTNQDKQLRILLKEERQAKIEIQKVIMSKDALIQQLSVEFNEQVTNRNKIIENLERRLDESTRLPSFTSHSDSEYRQKSEQTTQIVKDLQESVFTLNRQKVEQQQIIINIQTAFQTQRGNLEKAQAYITELIENIKVSQKYVEDSKVAIQSLIEKNNKLSEQNQKLIREKKNVQNQTDIVNAQNKILKKQLTEKVQTNQKTYVNVNQSKKIEQLQIRLKEAQTFIHGLQGRIGELAQSEEILRNQLNQQRSTRQQVQLPEDAASKEVLRQAKYDIEVLTRENRQLKVKIQEVTVSLQKAEGYIAENLGQSGPQSQIDVDQNLKLKQQLQKTRQQKHQIQISLNSQRQQLKLQINQLNNVLIQVKQQFDKNAQQAKRQVRILKQICGASTQNMQSIPPQGALTFQTIYYELTTIKSQKQSLLKSLSTAEDEIIRQEQRINSLVNNQLQLNNALKLQIQARSKLQSLISENNTQMKRIRFMFEEELKLKNNVINDLEKHLEEAKSQIHNLNLKLQQNQNRQITNEKDRNNQLEEIINNLRLEKSQQESLILSFKQQIQSITAEKQTNRSLFDKSTAIEQECLSLRHEIDLLLLEKQTQVKNLEKAEQYISVLHEQINKDREQVQKSSSFLLNQNRTLINQNQTLTNQNRLLSNQNESLVKERQTLRRQIEIISNQNKEILAKNKELTNKLESLSINFNSLSAEKQKLVINNQKLETDIRQNQIRLQQQNAKHLQNQSQLNKLTQIIAQNKVEIEKKSQQAKNIQEAYNKLISDAQIKQRQETDKLKEGKKLKNEQIDELNNLKATNQELHTHLQTAENFILDLQKHLKNLVQAETELKNTLEHEIQTKRVIEVAIQEKQAEIRKLSIEVEQSNAKLNPLTKIVGQLQYEKKTAVQRAAQYESLLNDNIRQLEQLKAKLMEAQNYIFALEDQIKQLRQRLNQAESNIIQLSEQSNRIKQKVSSEQLLASQQKKDENNQQITLLQKEINNLQLERQRNSEELQKKQANLRTLTSDLERKDRSVQESERKVKLTQEQVNFFKIKLASAEQHIIGVEKILSQKDEIIRNQISQLQAQQKHTTQIVESLANAERKILSLNNEILTASEKIKQLEEVIKAQQSSTELQNLQKLTNDLQERLRISEINRQNLMKEKAEAESRAINIIQNLKKAEIKIEQQKNISETQRLDLQKEKSINQQAKIQIKTLQDQNNILSTEVASLIKNLQKSEKDSQFFKSKLLDAETYIIQVEQTLPDKQSYIKDLEAKIQEANKKIEELNDSQNQSFHNLSQSPQSQSNQLEKSSQIESPIHSAQFFRNKLLEAESFIHELQQQNSKIISDSNGWQEQLNSLRKENENVKKLLAETNKANTTLKNDKDHSIIKLEQEIKIKEKITKELNDQTVKFKDLNDRLEIIIRESKEKDITINSLKRQNQQLLNSNKTIEQASVSQKALVESLTQQIQSLKTQSETLINKIAELEQEIQTASERANQEFKNLNTEIVRTKKQLSTLEIENTTLKSRLASISSQSRQEDLKQQLVVLQKEVQRLNKVHEIDEESLKTKENEILTLSAALEDIQKPKVDLRPQSPEQDALFFKNKLLEAEQYIEQMDHINFTNQQIFNQQRQDSRIQSARITYLQTALSNVDKVNASLQEELIRQKQLNKFLTEAEDKQISSNEIITLQNKNKQLQIKLSEVKDQKQKNEKANEQLIQRVSQLNGLVADLKKEKETSDNQAIFFKGKLFQAESYITELQQSTHTNEELSNKIKENVLLQDQVKQLTKDLNTQREEKQLKVTQLITLQKTAKQLEEESEFFRKKLLEAETYINHIQQTINHQETIEEEKQRTADAETLAKNWEAKAKEIDSKNKELSIMNQQLMSQLSDRKQNQEIRKLEDNLIQLRTALQQLQKDNKILKSRLTQQRSLQKVSQKQSNSQGINFKAKLLEAESYIHELEQENNQLGDKVEELNTLREDFEECNRLLEEAEERSHTLATELERTGKENQLMKKSNIGLKDKVASLVKEIDTLKINFAKIQTYTSSHEVVDLAADIEQKKPIESVQEDRSYKQQIQEQKHQKLNTQSLIQHQGATQKEKTAELQFLANKLKQAEEIIIQQQNQIAQLTDELIHFQNDFNTLKRQLSTKRREEEDMEDAIRQLSATRQGLIERMEPLEQANQALREQVRNIREKSSRLQEDNATLSERIIQQSTEAKTKQERIHILEKENNQLAEQIASPEEDHQKFIELEAEILQLKEGNDLLWKDLQELRRDHDRLQQALTLKEEQNKQLSSKLQEASQQSAEYDNLLKQCKENLEANNLLSQQNQKLRNILQEGMNSSTRLSLQKEIFRNQQIDLLKNKLNSELNKVKQLEGDIEQREDIIADLQKRLNEALFDLQNSKQDSDRLIQTHQQTLTSLQQELQRATQQVATLNGELAARKTTIQQLVPMADEKDTLLAQNKNLKIQNGNIIAARVALLNEVQEARREVQTLKEDKQQLLSKLKEAETYIVSQQDDINKATTIFKNVTTTAESLKHETNTLKEQLRRASTEKEKLLADIRALQGQVQLTQSDNQKLNSKINYLHSLKSSKDQEIPSLSEISREREIQKQKKSRSHERQDNVLSEELKDNGNSVRQLSETIRSLTAELQRKEEENRQLMVQRLNLQDQLNEIQQQLAHSKEHDTHEQLNQHLVEADRANLELQEHNQQLTAEMEALARDKAYLQFQLTQLKTQIPQTSQQNDTLTRKLQLEIEQLRLQLEQTKRELHEERAKNEELLITNVQNDSLRHLKEDLEANLLAANAEKAHLLQNLTQAQQIIAGLQTTEAQRRQEEDKMVRRANLVEKQLGQAKTRIGEQQAQAQQGLRQEALIEDLQRLLGGVGQQVNEDIMQHLQNFPYLQEFIKSILYRLQLSSALELQKSLKIKQLNDEILILQDQLQRAHQQTAESTDLKTTNELLRAEIIRLEEEGRTRHQEPSERLVKKQKVDRSLSAPSREILYAQFLSGCLQKVVDLEREVQEVERKIQLTALEGTQRSQPSEQLAQDSLQQRLQELEDKLLRNAHHIQEHQQRSDGELYNLLQQLAEARQLPQASRTRIEDYLAQLEQQILREHEQHQNEVSRLKDQLASYAQPSGRSSEQPGDSARGTREELLREITHLNNAIEIYYQESMRRKKNYRRTLESLYRDISRLGDQPNPNPNHNPTLAQMAQRIRFAIEDEDKQDRKQMEIGDDFIITSGSVQQLEREPASLPLGPGEDRDVQTEDDAKPFLAFLLSNQGLQKDDLRLLKRKVAELRSREVEESLAALKEQEKRLQQVLQLGGREAPQQLDNIMVTLANTYSRDQISQIFGSDDNDQLLNKLNEALEESFLRGDSATMLQNILERKNRYYDSPTKLSEQVHEHLVVLLSAKRDEDFYQEIDGLFRDLYQIQVGFQEALRKKDELYRFHNERMNQIFNRSSSDGSEQYIAFFERQGQEHADPDPLEMRSQSKPRRSEPESENNIEQ